MENPLDTNVGGGLTITSEMREYLSESAKWGKFLAIAGFIGMGLMVLIGIGMGVFMSTMGDAFPDDTGLGGMIGGGFISVFYILLAMVYFFPLLYLYRFSTKMKTALAHDDQNFLAEAFKNHKSLYKFMGIFTAIFLGLYAVILVVSLVGGLGAAMFG